MTWQRLKGGIVYDPVNNVRGEVRDIWFHNGRIDTPLEGCIPNREWDISGLVVMPGGIDLHCHIAGPKVNAARKMLPEDRRDAPVVERTQLLRSGTAGIVPSTFTTGYLYAGMGYTTAIDAAIPPLAARHVHEEFSDTPILDKGFLALIGNNHLALEQLRANEPQRLASLLAWMLGAIKAYGFKLVNPGGVELWKSGFRNAKGIDDDIIGWGITPRLIIEGISRAVEDLALPHPIHIHCNNLGVPGNWETTLKTMESLNGARGHLTHIQFHSYAGDPDNQETFGSAVPQLADYVNRHPELTVDVGQVMFGSTTSMTGDGPLGHYLHQILGGKWFSHDLELESGCGIVPIRYQRKSLVHALQWAIGLEWFLLTKNPWQVALTTDHPNGASFLAYPEIIALLMDPSRRREALQQLPAEVRNRCTLADLDRAYSLEEITIITRAAPARMLGLTSKGHLGTGADADITVYTPGDDKAVMFSVPRLVFKGGDLIVENHEIRQVRQGATWTTVRNHDPADESHILKWFDDNATIRGVHFPVDPDLCGVLRTVD